MNWIKNSIENLIYIVVIFICLAIYTSIVLQPIIVEAINKETSKIENNIKTNIDNKFKKIDELNAKLPLNVTPVNTQQPPTNNQQKIIYSCGQDSVCIAIKHLTRKQKKRLGLK